MPNHHVCSTVRDKGTDYGTVVYHDSQTFIRGIHFYLRHSDLDVIIKKKVDVQEFLRQQVYDIQYTHYTFIEWILYTGRSNSK